MPSHVIFAIVLGAFLSTLIDWVFAGILFHDRYRMYPEIWRQTDGEALRILFAQAFVLMTSIAFMMVAFEVHQTALAAASRLAVLVWLIAPLPILATNAMFIKIDHMVTLSHAVGWLAKLLVIAASVSLFL